MQVAEDGRSLRLGKPYKKFRDRALLSQDAVAIGNKQNRDRLLKGPGANAYIDSSIRNSQPLSKNEFASTAVGSQHESAYEEWPELHEKLTKMHSKE